MPRQEWPAPDEIYAVGCVARIRQVLELPGNETMKLLVEGRNRARLISIVNDEPYYRVEVSSFPTDVPIENAAAL